MSRTIKHAVTKNCFSHLEHERKERKENCFSHLEHERKERKEERAKNVEFLNATLDLNVKED